MGQFKEFMEESADLLGEINARLADLSPAGINTVGNIMHMELFDDGDQDEFLPEDIQAMLGELAPDEYLLVLDILEDEEEDITERKMMDKVDPKVKRERKKDYKKNKRKIAKAAKIRNKKPDAKKKRAKYEKKVKSGKIKPRQRRK